MEEDNENKVKGKQDEEKEDKLPDKKSSRYLFIALGLIMLVFAGFFISRWYFSSRQEILTIDDMHRMNLEGKESDKNYMLS